MPICVLSITAAIAAERQFLKKDDLVGALQAMIDYDGPYLLDVEVPYIEHVLPMIPSGMTVKDLIRE